MNVMVRRAGRMFKEGKSEASGHCLLTEGNLIFFQRFSDVQPCYASASLRYTWTASSPVFDDGLPADTGSPGSSALSYYTTT